MNKEILSSVKINEINEIKKHNWTNALRESYGEFTTSLDNNIEFKGILQPSSIKSIEISRLTTNAHGVEKQKAVNNIENTNSFLVLQLKGNTHLEQQHNNVTLQEGDATLMDQRLPFTLQFSNEIEHLIFKIPISIIKEFVGDNKRMAAKKINTRLGNGYLLRKYLHSLQSSIYHGNELELDFNLNTLTKLVGVNFSNSDKKLSTNESQEMRLNEIKLFIQNNLMDLSLSIDEISRKNCISQRQLYNLFERSETTPCEWLKLYRLDYAIKMMLSNEYKNHSIAYISENSGFSDLSYFSRLFSKKFDLSPARYRKEHNKFLY